mmetsp:Transcript_4723/g.10204  ORF Transcript_4723/g.10204 Transcript_4723/m.10204 type:complete len:243 (-) Transcript_4723:334-1062(-)
MEFAYVMEQVDFVVEFTQCHVTGVETGTNLDIHRRGFSVRFAFLRGIRHARASQVELKTDSRTNVELGVRIATRRVVNGGVHQTFNRHSCPVDVVAQASRGARLRAKRNELAFGVCGDDLESIETLNRELHKPAMITGEVWLTSDNLGTRFKFFIPNDEACFGVDRGVKVTQRRTSTIRVTLIVRFISDILTEAQRSAPSPRFLVRQRFETLLKLLLPSRRIHVDVEFENLHLEIDGSFDGI